MKPIGWRRKTGIAAMLLGCALVFARCDAGPLAGSSVTTGNPTEIQVSFTDENGPVALAGRVDVYGSTQVPVPGFDSEPLASVEVSGQKDVILKPGHFTAIPDTMWPEGSLEGDSLAHFNLVITGDGKGAILRDMTWRRKAGEFILGSIYTQARKQKAESRLEAGLTPLTEYTAFIKPSLASKLRLNYLFLKGTGFAVLGTEGNFHFLALPEGDHTVSYLSLPDPAIGQASIEDSARVYSLNRPISSLSSDTLSVTELDFQVPMPEQFKN